MLDPPQTKSVWPVTKLLAGSQKKRNALVTSSTCPKGPTGMRFASSASSSAMGRLAREAVEAGALGFTTSRTLNHQTSDGDPTPTLTAAANERMPLATMTKAPLPPITHSS